MRWSGRPIVGGPQTADQIDNRKELELANWRKAPDPLYLDVLLTALARRSVPEHRMIAVVVQSMPRLPSRL
jgi:hypothetical protein